MTGTRAINAVQRVHLSGVDPAAVWVLVADPERLEEWTPVKAVDWGGDLPEVSDVIRASIRVAVRERELRCVIADWQAGHLWRWRVEGFDRLDEAEMLCSVSSIVEEGVPTAEVEVRFRATGSGPMAWVARRSAERRLRRALRDLSGLVG